MPEAASAELSELELLKMENERLKSENKALFERDMEAKGLGEVIKSKTALWEQCKEEAKNANDARIDAMEELASFVRGDVQTTIDEVEKDAQMTIDEAIKQPAKAAGSDLRKVCGTFRAMQFNLTREKLAECDCDTLRPNLEAEAKKRKVVAIECGNLGTYLPMEEEIFEDGSGYYNAWPLLDPQEWDERLEEIHGARIGDLGDIDEGRPVNFTGFEVKVGRKKFVVGPDDEVVRLIYGPDGLFANSDCQAAKLMGDAK